MNPSQTPNELFFFVFKRGQRQYFQLKINSGETWIQFKNPLCRLFSNLPFHFGHLLIFNGISVFFPLSTLQFDKNIFQHSHDVYLKWKAKEKEKLSSFVKSEWKINTREGEWKSVKGVRRRVPQVRCSNFHEFICFSSSSAKPHLTKVSSKLTRRFSFDFFFFFWHSFVEQKTLMTHVNLLSAPLSRNDTLNLLLWLFSRSSCEKKSRDSFFEKLSLTFETWTCFSRIRGREAADVRQSGYVETFPWRNNVWVILKQEILSLRTLAMELRPWRTVQTRNLSHFIL